MSTSRLLFLYLLFSLLLLSAQTLPAQSSNAIIRFHVQGNLNAKIRPNETVKIIVSAEAQGPGTLDFRMSEFPPPFIVWDSSRFECGVGQTCAMSDTIYMRPGSTDYGRHSFNMFARFFINGVQADEASRRVRVDVIPKLEPEPPFTPTAANTVCWHPFEENFSYELVTTALAVQSRVAGDRAILNNLMSLDSCDVVDGLPEGVPFEYLVRGIDNATGLSVESDRMISIQDQTLPPATGVESFVLDPSTRTVTLRWPRRDDQISFIEKYVISRRQAQAGVPVPIDTLFFFPVRSISPRNYYPVLPERGQRLYVDDSNPALLREAELDTDFTLDDFPLNILRGSVMLRGGLNDRWNEREDFLSFQLEVDSHLFIAYDANQLNFSIPEWLRADFAAVGKSVETKSRRLRLYKSREVFKAGRVVLGGNFAIGASLINKEPLQYVVFVQPVTAVLPFAADNEIEYHDVLSEADDKSVFRYRISTVDAAGNVSHGPESVPIAADLSSRCVPEIVQWSNFNKEDSHFSKGLSNLVCIRDPRLDLECAGFRETDSLRFQAARESTSLFESRAPGSELFDSEWFDFEAVGDQVCYSFDLEPPELDENFVHGKKYFYRVRGKDRFGNVSIWSDTVFSVQDAFAPPDILGLSAVSDISAGQTSGCNRLTWSGGVDAVSGTRAFVIYRGLADSGTSAAIDTVDGMFNSYRDSLSGFTSNAVVTYRIGSIDNVENVRTAEGTNQEVTIRPLVGPQIEIDDSLLLSCLDGRTRVDRDSIDVFWPAFDVSEVVRYSIRILPPDGSRRTKFVLDGGVRQARCSLDAGDGFYSISLRAIYAGGDTTIFSNVVTIRKKVSVPQVSELRVEQDPRPTGDVVVHWSHSEMEEVESFEIFAWPEGSDFPQQPIAVVSGDETNWRRSFEDGALVAYRCDNYAIRVKDCFGLISDPQPIVTQFSNRPPVFDPEASLVENDRLTVCWERPEPRLNGEEAFAATIVVYQDSIAGAPFASETFVNETCFTLFNPLPGHNYIFKVQERIIGALGQSCADDFSSNFSERIILPFMNLPRSVEFVAQALPAHPDSSAGNVFLSWDMSGNEQSTFSIEYSPLSDPQAGAAIDVQQRDTLLVRGLDTALAYGFDIFAIDSLGQRSAMSETQEVSFKPLWRFTPKPAPIVPVCFRDSVTVRWDWVDEALAPVNEQFGADSVFVQASGDPRFVFPAAERKAGLVKQMTLSRRDDLPFLNNQNTALFVRVRAKDRWGHLSPWSTVYPELGVASASLDEEAPSLVSVRVDSVKAPVFGESGLVDVYLGWESARDNCSGVWFYEIDRGDVIAGRDTTAASQHSFVDRNLVNDERLLSIPWRIFAVDSAGNRQMAADSARVQFSLAAPDSGWCRNDSTACWTAAKTSGTLPVVYFAEGARFASLFGNSVTNAFSGPLDSLCWNFDVPWEQMFWRVKARAGAVESAWSDTFFCQFGQVGGLLTKFSEGALSLPTEFQLQQNYPNPFNPSTTIEYAIPVSVGAQTRIVLEVFNIQGQRVRSLANSVGPPGVYSAVWHGRDDFGNPVGSGLYMYRIRVADFVRTRKMLLVK